MCYQNSPPILLGRILVGIICFLLGHSTASADWHGQLSVLSDYVYRGYSKSRGNPVVQGQLDFQGESGWYAGLGLSQVSFDDQLNSEHAEIEMKPFAGWSLPISADWRTDLSIKGYLYNDKIFAEHSEYAEIYASLHFKDYLSGLVSIAPNAYNREVDLLNYELNYRYDLLDNVQFSSGLGYYQADALLEQDYFYWNLGASWFITSYLALDIRYSDSQLNEYHDEDNLQDEFYPRLQENKYLISLTLGF